MSEPANTIIPLTPEIVADAAYRALDLREEELKRELEKVRAAKAELFKKQFGGQS